MNALPRPPLRGAVLAMLLAVLLTMLAPALLGAPPKSKRAAATPTPRASPLAAGFLVLPHVYGTELVAAYDVLHHVRFHAKPAVTVFTVSLDGKAVETFEGLHVSPDYALANAPRIDILVIPSAEHNRDTDLKDEALRAWVKSAASSAQYVVTLCDGAFLLASTGLLDGRKATTFPADVARFRELFPLVQTVEDVSFVQDGKLLTSQGGARSYDVALYLVDLLFGERAASGVAQGLVLTWPNPAIPFTAPAPANAASTK